VSNLTRLELIRSIVKKLEVKSDLSLGEMKVIVDSVDENEYSHPYVEEQKIKPLRF